MRKKKNQALIPFILLGVVIVLSIAALTLADNLRQARIENPGDITNQDDIPRATAAEAYEAVSNGEAVLVDTRSQAVFQSGHAAGAINIPVDQVEVLLGELDPDTWYITYCT
jgi:3-mercaptopyruvate sulfurtransferase SseA